MTPRLQQPPLQTCTPLAWPTLSDAQAAQLEQLLKALADRHNVKILNLLARAGEPACVCDLVERLRLKQPAVSYHLKRLTDAGLLVRERRGTYAYYQPAPGALDQCATLLRAQPTRAATPERPPTSTAQWDATGPRLRIPRPVAETGIDKLRCRTYDYIDVDRS